MIIGLHNVTGTPWYLTIPLVAVSVGAVFRLPFVLNNNRLLQERTKYTPIIQAWGPIITRRVVNSGVTAQDHDKVVKERTEKAIKSLWERAGLQQRKLYTGFISLPFWLIAIDSIRRLCGGPRGLLGSIFLPAPTDGKVTTTPSPAPNPVEPSTAYVPDWVGSVETGAGVAPSSTVDAIASGVDTSLMTEGALWFQDLTVADPYGILPVTLSAVLLYNVIPKQTSRARELFGVNRGPEADDNSIPLLSKYTPLQRGFGRSMIILSMAVGPLTMDLPAAVHLYWLTSALFSAAGTQLAAYMYPIESKIVRPCQGVELPVIRPKGSRNTSA